MKPTDFKSHLIFKISCIFMSGDMIPIRWFEPKKSGMDKPEPRWQKLNRPIAISKPNFTHAAK